MGRRCHPPSFSILEGEFQSAELGAGTTVGTPAEAVLRGITHPGEAHTERPVDESLELHLRHLLMDGAHLIEREFPGQHHPGKSLAIEPSHLSSIAVVGLCAGVQFHLRAAQPLPATGEQSHVLHEEGIGAGIGQFLHQVPHLRHLLIIDQGIEGDIDLGLELVRMTAQAPYVIDRVDSGGPGTKLRCAYIDSVGTMVDGGDTALQVLGRCQQFQFSHDSYRMALIS